MTLTTFHSIKQHLSTLSIDQRGKTFERYCKWFLENDPRYSLQLKKVWFWKDWPRNWGRDKGIDLIAETHNGALWAIQVKAYDDEYYVTKEDVDTFLSETARKNIAFRLLIATTNNIGPNAQEVLNGQEKPIGLCLLNALEKSPVDWGPLLTQSHTPSPVKKNTPFPHQAEALKAIARGFQTSDKGQVHMACGTGKTLVGLWATEELKAQRILVLVPSLSLVSQLFSQWAFHARTAFNPIFVCSDETIGNSSDDGEYTINTANQLGLPVTTNAADLLDKITSHTGKTIVFATYHSSPVIEKACQMDENLTFDIAIADEAHRCAGKADSYFATITHHGAIRAIKKLFMTATPKYFSENVKKKTQELDCHIVSMDDPEKFGPVFYKLPFSEAIKRELLSDYQVVISVMDNATYQVYIERGRLVKINNLETDARTLASQLLVAKAMQRYDLKRVISFHNRTKNAKEFIASFVSACQLLPESERTTVNFLQTIFGEMPQSKRDAILKQFKEATQEHAGLIANVKCLSEGVDVPALDAVAFIDPKGSEIDIIQSVGRAIRKSPNKTKGTILIPIFVDTITDEEESFEQSCFAPIWRVVKALRAHDDMLAEELDSIRLELGKRTYKAPAKLVKIVMDVPTNINIDFSSKLNLKLVGKTSFISLADSHPDIAAQWHPTKNGNLKPEKIIAGSAKSIWWLCSNDASHEWQAKGYSRTKLGSGCPFCSGKKVNFSNCLQTTNPEIAKLWHPINNRDKSPDNVTSQSGQKVWWRCPAASDHEWQASVAQVKGAFDRNSKFKGCPFCSGVKVSSSNSLATVFPSLAVEWNSEKNKKTPEKVHYSSHKKAWWNCLLNKEHVWFASIKSRSISGNKCPVCRGSVVDQSNCLAARFPEIAQEWHPTKNVKLTSSSIHHGTKKKVWWICAKNSDHEWVAQVANRTVKKSNCPHCLTSKRTK